MNLDESENKGDSLPIETATVPVICIGASAGGLEAFREMVGQLGQQHQQAYVIIQHLDPDHESLLPDLLQKRTDLPVVSIYDGAPLEGGKIFLIPPGAGLAIADGKLILQPFAEPRGLRRPIDRFLESLAQECGSQCAAVILSGTGGDGSNGVKAVKEAGGLVFVQDPRQAKYDGMPKAAIASGAVDLVLPVKDIVPVIEEYFDRRSGIEPQIRDDTDFLKRIAKHVRYRTGNDFEHYKHATVMRRVIRRMSVLGTTAPEAYLSRLIADPKEAEQLCRDLLINVTSFFRDAECFDVLRAQAISRIVAEKKPGEEIRIWVPGCSTGQEAYSIAMLVSEEIARVDANVSVSVFATDIDEETFEFARQAVYPTSIVSEVPKPFLERYFDSLPDGYRIKKNLREIVRVSRHNIISDPPFSRLDLISCRNLLIYLENSLQDRLTQIFHYSLRPNGFLFLGPSETPAHAHTESFRPISRLERLYQRDSNPSRVLDPPLLSTIIDREHATPNLQAKSDRGTIPVYQDAVLARHTPPHIVINDDRELIYSSSNIERYLGLPEGRARLDVFDLAKPELRTPLRGLVASASKEPGSTVHRHFDGKVGDTDVHLLLTLERLEDRNELLIVFQDRFDSRPEIDDVAMASGGADDENTITLAADYVRDLEQKLDAAQQTIRTTVEELETSNEELKSSNEEMMSMNEELQSANEELSTINEELQNKNAELTELNDDLQNLVASIRIGIIFLDEDLRLRSFTPEAKNYFRLVEKDEGRPFDHIQTDLNQEELLAAAREVLETRKPKDFEQQTGNGEVELLVSILPYRTAPGDVSGVVMSFTPITEIRQSSRELERARSIAQERLHEIEDLYRLAPQAMGMIGPDHRLFRCNQLLADLAESSIGALRDAPITRVMAQFGIDATQSVQTVFQTGEPVLSQEAIRNESDKSGDPETWEIDWYPISQEERVTAVAVTVRDVTRHKAMQAELQRLMRELQHRVKNMLGNVIALVNRARHENDDPDVVIEKLVSRIRALASTHNLLTAENWRPTRFRDILVPELISVYGEDRVELRGPDVKLNARAAVALGMTLHELITNAAKYGALSNDTGTLSVQWSLVDEGDGGKFVIRWRERGGPSADQPELSGFGSQLIRATVKGSLRGRVEKEFSPEGLHCIIEIPIEQAMGPDTETNE